MLPNLVLFQGMDATGTNHLWETDGTASGTFALTPISGEPGYGFAPDPGASLDLMVFNDQVLFNGRYSITNYGLWTTDGATTGTKQLTGIAGANSAGIFTANVSPDFTLYNGVVLFSGFDTAGDYGLWTTNGTAAGTSEITVNGAASTGVNPSDMTVFNASVLFNGFDSAGNQGLWTTTGAASGAAEITGIIGVRTTGGLDPTDMTVFNGDILFNGADCPGCGKQMGRELTGVTGASASGIAPSDLTVFDGKVLFSGLDSTGHFQLWETDGTVAGTQELTTTTTTAFHQGVAPSGMEVYDGRVLFSGLDANGVVTSLWTTDGTTAGTHEVTPIADTQRHRQWSGGPQSWTWLERGGNRRLRRRRPFRHLVAERGRSGRDLGNERDERNRQWSGGPLS